jgi:hypothetical protein
VRLDVQGCGRRRVLACVAFSIPDSGIGALGALTGVLSILVGLLIVRNPGQTIAALALLLGGGIHRGQRQRMTVQTQR